MIQTRFKKSIACCGVFASILVLGGCQSEKFEALLNQGADTLIETMSETTVTEEVESVMSATEPVSRPATQEVMTYEAGQVFQVNNYNNEAVFEVVLTDVSYTDERNTYQDLEANEVAVLTFAIKNTSTQGQYFSTNWFQFYDESGMKLPEYSISSSYYSSTLLSAGRHTVVQTAVALKEGKGFEIELYDEWGSQSFGSIWISDAIETPYSFVATPNALPTIELNEVVKIAYEAEDLFNVAVTKVEWTESLDYERGETHPTVILTIEGENLMSTTEYLSESYFAAYDETGKQLLPAYPNTTYPSAEEIAPQKRATIQIAYFVPVGTIIEIEIGEMLDSLAVAKLVSSAH